MTRPIWERLRERMDALEAARAKGQDPSESAKRRAERAKIFQRRPEKAEPPGARLPALAFRKGPERYGIPLRDILQVEALRHLTPIPGAPLFVRGAVPWRGSILSLIDLGRLFGLMDSGLVDLRAFIVVDAGGRRVAVGAEDIETALAVFKADIRPMPAPPAGCAPEWFLGVVEENRVLLAMAEILRSDVLTSWKGKGREPR